MKDDPIVTEVRKIRQKIAAKFNGCTRRSTNRPEL
jgi:hypothetical protein